ncbi:MAG: DUF5684 domain-containing protein [Acidobacteriota bacterium]|nr:DUF5684 domain-containing protein [Acidobacteriota bacterium]
MPLFLFLLFQDAETYYDVERTSLDTTTLWILVGVSLVFMIFFIACFWKIFEKAGQPGWASIIPIYSTIVLLKIAGKPWWWIFLLCIPLVNIYFVFVFAIDLAKNFGKGTGFGVGLVLLGIIFFPILAFGDARYMPYQQFQPQYPPQPQFGGYR